MKNSQKKLNIVIVNYNAGDHLKECIKSVFLSSGKIDFNIWVVDNNSSDESLQNLKRVFPKLNYIENEKNFGFGAANNQALRKIRDEFILLLNPDTKVSIGSLDYTLDYLKNNPEVGAATCKAVHEDGSIDWAYHRGLPTPWASFLYMMGNDSLYHLSYKDMTKAHEVDAISGSFFLTRKSVLDKVGLFDEDYFMYAEDIDLCFRIKKAGYKVFYLPEVSVIHYKGVSSGIKGHSQDITTANLETRRRSLDYFHKTMKIFYKKHLEKKYPFFINWLVFLGINIRWTLAKRKLKV